ncbi:YceI family protein [Chitinophaga deserti]|uniref:YceI family protein n=1 Tax=Chitinophaga deserti TaxID=2164099 RepID=UPI000D6D8049|nr:YceI family protein [Chitinophaga deserti]
MRKIATILFISGAAVLMSFNAPVSLTQPSVKEAKAPVAYKVDGTKSKIAWLAKKVTGSHNGFISVTGGDLQVDGSTLTGGTFTVDTRTMTVDDIKDANGNARLLNHLKSDDFFSVEKHPNATFVITSVKKKSGTTHDITGNLTIKGITQPVTFPAEIAVNGSQLNAKATIVIDRTKFDIKYRSKSFFENLGDKTIYDEFTLDVELVANK